LGRPTAEASREQQRDVARVEVLAFSHFERTDHILVSLNLLELMSVAFLPVPTGILGTWVVSEPNRFFAVLFYGGTLIVLGIFHNLLWWYGAYRVRLTSPTLTAPKRRALTLTWMAGPVLYAMCVGLAWLDPRVSLAGFVLLGILYLLPTPRVLVLAQRTRDSRRSGLRR
jgi:TMEM175 potassium channel family protein